MDTRFGRLMGRLHSVGQARTADSLVDYLDRQGSALVEGLAVAVDDSVERLNEQANTIDRVRTISALKAALRPLDRKGAFRDQAGKVWHIDGIHADDGHLITFYVVP